MEWDVAIPVVLSESCARVYGLGGAARQILITCTWHCPPASRSGAGAADTGRKRCSVVPAGFTRRKRRARRRGGAVLRAQHRHYYLSVPQPFHPAWLSWR